MAESRPRIFQDSRDIGMSLLAIIVMMALTVGFTGLCSFDKDAPENLPVPVVDAPQVFSLEARAMNFPVRLPDTPPGWRVNSARRTAIQNAPAPIVGWLTATRSYVQLIQTDQPVEAILRYFPGGERAAGELLSGVSGAEFRAYPVEGDEHADAVYIADLGAVRLVLSGVAPESEFATAATATLVATPLPQAG